jgi:hypothetical protein
LVKENTEILQFCCGFVNTKYQTESDVRRNSVELLNLIDQNYRLLIVIYYWRKNYYHLVYLKYSKDS